MYHLKVSLQVRLNLQGLTNVFFLQTKISQNTTTLQISNSILYNFYFMQICHIFTFGGLKLQKKTIFGQSFGRFRSKSCLLSRTDLKNSTTFQIANSILYNFYFMPIIHIFIFGGLKLQKSCSLA